MALTTVSAALQDSTAQYINYKNKLINGNFDFWQRGTSFNIAGNVYTTDRWAVLFDGTPAGGGVISRQTFTLGQTDVPNNPKYFFQYAFPNVGTPSNYIRQMIEGVNTLAGQISTFSFWARTTSGTLAISAQFQQEFGSGGSPSSGVYGIGSTNFTATTTWQKFSFTTTLPSISGKTIGTNNNDSLNAAIVFPSNAAGTIQIAQAQVEAGSVATAFDLRPYGAELALCQRYYLVNSTVNYHASLYGGGVYLGQVELKTSMRAAPTVTLLSGGGSYVFGLSDTLHFYFTGTGSTFISTWNASAEL